jgi:hypothetical protein
MPDLPIATESLDALSDQYYKTARRSGRSEQYCRGLFMMQFGANQE